MVGIGVAEGEFLKAAAQVGVSFERTLTLGRQSLTMSYDDLERLAPGVERGWAEAFLERLGASVIRSLDATGYEGATDIHDLNVPIADDMDEQFTAVIDSGTIEHVFNVPEVMRSTMRMVERGGHLLMMTPCNNAPGHGFYQFTPEFVYRVLSPDNGYEMRRCMLRERRGRWYDVADPAGARCEFRTEETAYLFVVAQRIATKSIFERWPQQSDYVVAWERDPSPRTSNSPLAALVGKLPPRIRREVMRRRARSWPPTYKSRSSMFTPTHLS